MDMKGVGSRYQSLALKYSFNINLHTLARAGFYVNGKNNKTTCYSCGVIMEKWTYCDDIWEKHRFNSPDCEHIHVSGPVKNMLDLSTNAHRTAAGELSVGGDLSNLKLEVSLAPEKFIYLRKKILYLEYITNLADKFRGTVLIQHPYHKLFKQGLSEMEEEANCSKTVMLCQRITNLHTQIWYRWNLEMEDYAGKRITMTPNRIEATVAPLRFDCLEKHIDYLDMVAVKMNKNRLEPTDVAYVSQLLRELMIDLKSRCAAGERTRGNEEEMTALEIRVICALVRENYQPLTEEDEASSSESN